MEALGGDRSDPGCLRVHQLMVPIGFRIV
jgi:hypothetical protein